MFTTFYNETIRKTVIGFGSFLMTFLFKDLTQVDNLKKDSCSDLVRTKREIYSNASRVPSSER